MRRLPVVVALGMLTVSFLFSAARPAEGESHPFSAQDLVTMARVSDPQPSPDGTLVAFVVRETDLAANRGRTDLWLVEVDGEHPRQLTRDPAADSDPRWSPDGQWLYFLSSRSGSSQVWRLPMAGGEAEQVTRLPLDVGSYAVSPRGTHLAVALDVFLDCQDLACSAKRVEAAASSKATGRLYDHLFVRHWDTWKDGRRSHLFVLPTAGGEAVDVARGLDADAPSKPFGGSEEFTFTPDGEAVIFAARLAGKSEPWSTNLDLWLAPIDGSAAPKNLTAGNQALDSQPQFSPDGRTLAYLAMSRPGYEADRQRIMLRPWPEGEAKELAPAWDRSPDGIVFSADGKTLFVAAHDLGHGALFAIDLATAKVSRLFADGTVRSPAVAGDLLVFGRDHLRSPVDLYTLDAHGNNLRQITNVNAARLATIRFGEPEQMTFAGWNGETVHAWVVKPVDFDPAKRYPLAFLIHGGPQGSFASDFHYRWNPEIYAGAGYAAMMVDFHGSTGYGQAFTDSINNDWGGKPLVDLKAGLAAALKRYPWIDGSRACALGASYGGFMINWIEGNWPDGFRCLVNHDGVFDQRQMYYSTEELWFPEWEFGGPYYAKAANFEKNNPVSFVSKWKTPMLVVHGEQDFRIPYPQGLGAFTALQRQGVPSKLLVFPEENHWVLRPANSLQWHEVVLGWLGEWTAPR